MRPKHNEYHAHESSFDDYRVYIGGPRMDRFSGTDHMDIVFGRGGNDRLIGGDNDDDLMGGSKNDLLIGAAGMDHLGGGDGNDRLFGGEDEDGLHGGDGNDYLDEGAGHGDLEGGAGDDVLVGGLGADAFVVDPNSGHDIIRDFRAGPGMFDHLALRDIAPEELQFQDTAAGVFISWNNGESSVLLEGVFKADLAQDDFMFAEEKQLIPVGGFPENEIALASTSDTFIFINGHGASYQESFDEFLVRRGTDGNDFFEGTAARDFFFGLGGDDNASGGAGNDDLRGDDGNDTLNGGDGMDHLVGGDGDDHLYGGAMADTLMGGNGVDFISAGAGHDMINGGMGDDILDGGNGADAFMVNPTSGNDVVIAGFTPGAGAFDHIAFIGIDPDEVTISDTNEGALISWVNGSILLQGVFENQLVQDDFMFNGIEGGAFVNDPDISYAGSALLFPENQNMSSDNLLG